MNDHLGLFDGGDEAERADTGNVDLAELRAALARTANNPPPQEPPASPRRALRARRELLARRRQRRRRHTVVAMCVLAVLVAAIAAGFIVWRKNITDIPDFAGPPGAEVIVQIKSGDSRSDIAQTMATAGVVASSEAFVNETEADATVAAIRPGYYKVRAGSPARTAADDLVNPGNRVGQLRLIPGGQFADVSTRTGGGGKVTPGYVSEITKAACVPLNGRTNCWDAQALWKVVETADLSELGVVGWATDAVTQAPDPRKRLEGLLPPGDYDVRPGASPTEVLTELMQAATSNWSTSGIEDKAADAGLTPYQALVIASVVEREGNTADMPKVARVIYNRIQDRMKLQMDSTVNYALDRAQISTTAADRANDNPYNTYARTGLPPTPIAAAGPAAMAAAVEPAEGTWLFFVKIDKVTNASCFSTTEAQHQACVATARKNGVFDE